MSDELWAATCVFALAVAIIGSLALWLIKGE